MPELPEKVVVQSKHSSLPNGWSNSSLETKYNESPDRMREVESQTVHVNYCVDLVSGSFDIVIHKLNVPFIKFSPLCATCNIRVNWVCEPDQKHI